MNRETMMPAARLDWIDLLPFALLSVFVVLILGAPTRINHDCAYVIQCAQLLTMGKLPYVDFIDVNPPLIFYMNMLPVYAGRTAGITLPQAFSFFVLGQLALSTEFLWYLFRLRTLNLQPYARMALLLSWVLCSLYVYNTGDFGQRDYLVILMTFPFIIVRIIRYYGDSVGLAPALIIGLLTGVGLCLKPNFILIAAVPEVIALARTKNFRLLFKPEVVAAWAFAIVYLLHFFFLPAVVKSALFDRWLPFFIQYYGTINLNLFHHVFRQPLVIAGIAVLMAIAVVSVIIVRRRGTSSIRIEMLCGVVIGSFFSYWIQQKGYSYHTLPAKISFIMLALFSCFWFYDEVIRRREQLPFRGTIAVLPTFLVICSLLAVTVRSSAADRAYTAYEYYEPYRHAIRAHSAANDRVLFINTILFPAYPTLVQTDRLPGSRYLTSFPLAGFYYTPNFNAPFSYRSPDAMPAIEKLFLSELAADVRTNKPAIIFIFHAGQCSGMPAGFEMLTYFRRAHFIDDAMRDYAYTGTVVDFAMFLRRTGSETMRQEGTE